MKISSCHFFVSKNYFLGETFIYTLHPYTHNFCIHILFLTVSLLHKKWKNIRDNFSRDVQGRKRKSGDEGGTTKAPYMYSQQLQFLRDTVLPKETSSSLQGSLQQQPHLTNETSLTTPPPSTSQKTKIGKKKLNSVEERIILSLDRLDENKSKPVEKDDNHQFLLSLLPTLASLPKRLNSKCRLEIMQVVNKYEEYAFMQKEQPIPPKSPVVHQNLERQSHFDMPCSTIENSERMQQHTAVISQEAQSFNQNSNYPSYPPQHSQMVLSPVDSLASYVSNFSDESQF